MKVLLITASFPPLTSGGSDYALRLAQFLAETGVSVTVLTSANASPVNQQNLTTETIMQTWSWSELPRLISRLRALQPDVINLHFGGFLYNDHPMIAFLPTLAKWILPKVRVVTLFEAPIGVRPYLLSLPIRAAHRMLIELTRPFKVDYSFGTLLNASDWLVVLSAYHQEQLAAFDQAVNQKTVLIPVPPLMIMSKGNKITDRHRGRHLLGVTDSEFLIVYLGFLYPGKGIETLLQAFQLASEEIPNLRLAIIGGMPELLLKTMNKDNYGSELKTLATQLGVADRVIWTGGYESDSAEPSLYLSACDLCVLPFDRGVYLNNSSFAACAAHGLPIVTTLGPTLESPFKHNENVFLCPPQNPRLMADAIAELVNDQALRDRLSKNVSDLAERIFSWPLAIERTLSVFRGEMPESLL
jgi:glycosyltransferase involved in cell wall biosynthesis